MVFNFSLHGLKAGEISVSEAGFERSYGQKRGFSEDGDLRIRRTPASWRGALCSNR